MTVLPNLTQENETLKAQLADMQAQLLKANAPKAISMKVSEKGALSIYGMGRWPVTLYLSQVERLFHPEQVHAIHAFVNANRAKFTTKD